METTASILGVALPLIVGAVKPISSLGNYRFVAYVIEASACPFMRKVVFFAFSFFFYYFCFSVLFLITWHLMSSL